MIIENIEPSESTRDALRKGRRDYDDALELVKTTIADNQKSGAETVRRVEELESELVRLQAARRELLSARFRNPGDDHIVGLADNRSRTDAVKMEIDDVKVINELREVDYEARLSAAKTQASGAFARLKTLIETERRRIADVAISAIKDSGLSLMPFVLAYSERTLNGIWHECKPLSARRAEIPEELVLPHVRPDCNESPYSRMFDAEPVNISGGLATKLQSNGVIYTEVIERSTE